VLLRRRGASCAIPSSRRRASHPQSTLRRSWRSSKGRRWDGGGGARIRRQQTPLRVRSSSSFFLSSTDRGTHEMARSA
jgi:hypothetical protein